MFVFLKMFNERDMTEEKVPEYSEAVGVERTCCETGKNEKSGDTFKPALYPQILATFAATTTAFGMGTMEAYTSTALPSLNAHNPFGELSLTVQGNIAAIPLLAAFASGLPIGYLVNKVGRKAVLIGISLLFVTGYALMAAATSLLPLFVGRCITGFCSGAASLVAPIYVGEISEKSKRGLLASGFQLMATIGILFTYVAGTFVDWRWTAVACGIVPLLGLFLLMWVPASPRYLLSKGKRDDALAALMWLRGAEKEGQVETEFAQIQANLSMYAGKKKSIRDYVKMRTLRPLGICIALFLFQQSSGIEAFLMYTVHIFKTAGSTLDPNYCTIIVGALQVAATLSETVVVDRAGRRRLLLISELGAALSTAGLAAFFYLKGVDEEAVRAFGFVPLLCLGTFILFFAVGIGPVPFLMVAELNSPRMVGMASAVGTGVNWGFSFLSTFGMVWVETEWGPEYAFAAFTAASTTGLLFTWFFVPETKGRTMAEIQAFFQKQKKEVTAEKEKDASV